MRFRRIGLTAAALFLATQVFGYIMLAVFTAVANDQTHTHE